MIYFYRLTIGALFVFVFATDGNTFVNIVGVTIDMLGGNISGDGIKSGRNIGIPAAT